MERLLSRSWMCLLILLTDCITPFVPPTSITYPRLVVTGLITDQPGPYAVKLMSTSIASNTLFNDYPNRARVFIHDDTGAEEELTEKKGGNFETSPNGIRGIVGRAYSVTVILQDGRRYESTPEKLRAVPPIKNIFTVYKELPVGSSTVGKFVTYVETQDSDEAGDYYKWTWKHFSTRIYCAQTVIEFGDATPIKYRCCGPCWSIDQCESCINILSDQLVNGRKFSRFLLDIPYDSKEPYYLAVQQSSLSAGAFKFWESLNGQVNNGGGVFNSPPAAVAGNLSNVNNKDEQVLGYFGASAIAKKIIYISRDKIEKPPIPPVANFTISPNCFACKEGYFRTPHKPEGWID